MQRTITFKAIIHKLGINPCIDVPLEVIQFFGKTKIPVNAEINGYKFQTTIIKYSGDYRLYTNLITLKGAKINIGDEITVKVSYNPVIKEYPIPLKLIKAFEKDKELKRKFDELSPSRRKEILRYLDALKSLESKFRVINKLIQDQLVFFPSKKTQKAPKK